MNRTLFVTKALATGMILLSACATTKTGSTIPDDLKTIEGDAEDTFDQSMASHYDAVRSDAEKMDSLWTTYRQEAQKAGASETVLTDMDRAIAGLKNAASDPADNIVLARQANAISAPVTDLFALYSDPVPSPVLALDYLGREVVLDARQVKFADASTHVDSMESSFAGIQDGLIAAGGQQVSDDFKASIAAMRQDITAEDKDKLEADAKNSLDLVDVMEGVYLGK